MDTYIESINEQYQDLLKRNRCEDGCSLTVNDPETGKRMRPQS